MEELIRQKRVSFSDQPHKEEYYRAPDIEFAAAVAAASLSIYSLHEAEEQQRGKIMEEIKIRKEGSTIGSGENFKVKPSGVDQKPQQISLPNREASRSSSLRPMGSAFEDQRRIRNSQNGGGEDKAESWRKIQMQKINKRYEKTKSIVLVWERQKKMQAELQKQRKQSELEQRMLMNIKHYKNKLARIDKIVGEGRGELEEKRKNDEKELKERSKKIRSTGKAPVKCFCF
ncbi:remorin [Tripterygium wilfordii]|uniref:Remorin n=1 Tax=Tripterygium wilfordii TaxID=458696 RepID=A0A7J7C7R3_TRIWF|nr:remorin [Tripterygium wilfordii]